MRSRRDPGLAGNPILIGALTVLVTIVAVYLAYNATNGLPFVPAYTLQGTRTLRVRLAPDGAPDPPGRRYPISATTQVTSTPAQLQAASCHSHQRVGMKYWAASTRVPKTQSRMTALRRERLPLQTTMNGKGEDGVRREISEAPVGVGPGRDRARQPWDLAEDAGRPKGHVQGASDPDGPGQPAGSPQDAQR